MTDEHKPLVLHIGTQTIIGAKRIAAYRARMAALFSRAAERAESKGEQK